MSKEKKPAAKKFEYFASNLSTGQAGPEPQISNPRIPIFVTTQNFLHGKTGRRF
jgi:hypothetical protein